ncbi:hypothetical protein AB0L05_21890 [Nonomuraea pusilla]|uniref:hypothetical protein n=1 Tax=Nonomuraea pusilla TaxID=46177 RepID=UPI0033173F68
MSTDSGGERPVSRGGSEEASGAPLTQGEEEASRRPPGSPPTITPGVTPDGHPGDGGDESDHDEVDEADEVDEVDELDEEFNRLKELNPDDFE